MDGKRRNLAQVGDFLSWDKACDGTCFSHGKKGEICK